MKKHTCLLIGAAAVCLAARPHRSPAAAEDRPIWLAVVRPALAPAIRPLAEHRRKQGFRTVISSDPPGAAITSLPRRPAFVLLVGDDRAGPQEGQQQAAQPWCLPARRRPLYRWRRTQRATFASDTAWADVDGDLVPDVPIGRIPARTADQVTAVVRKIVAYEARAPGPADLALPVWAGSPGYDRTTDSMATGMLVATVQANAPAWAEPWLLSGDAAHALCGWPPDQPALFGRRLKQGACLGCLMGHGGPDAWYSMRFGGRTIRYTAGAAQPLLAAGEPCGPVVIFACDCGDFTRPAPCLAESLLWMPGGPVATIAATTESHPLTNYFSAVSLLEGLSGGAPDGRLGTLWLAAQAKAHARRNLIIEAMLRDVEGKLEPEGQTIDVAALRRDQLLMYALLGDPATRLRLPGRLHGKLTYGQDGWRWRVRRPEGATRLHVGFRPAASLRPRHGGPPGSAPAGPADLAAVARQKLAAANAQFTFQPIASLAADEPWEGTAAREGTLRLVATGSGGIHAAALRLKRPATQPVLPPDPPAPAGR